MNDGALGPNFLNPVGLLLFEASSDAQACANDSAGGGPDHSIVARSSFTPALKIVLPDNLLSDPMGPVSDPFAGTMDSEIHFVTPHCLLAGSP
jgi:hypothetical protein